MFLEGFSGRGEFFDCGGSCGQVQSCCFRWIKGYTGIFDYMY